MAEPKIDRPLITLEEHIGHLERLRANAAKELDGLRTRAKELHDLRDAARDGRDAGKQISAATILSIDADFLATGERIFYVFAVEASFAYRIQTARAFHRLVAILHDDPDRTAIDAEELQAILEILDPPTPESV